MKHPKAHILVVEDDAALRQGLMDVLVFNGYEVRGIADGLQALPAVLEAACDLVLLDVMLPGADGFSICREIRRRRPNQAVVMITAKGAEDDIVAGFKAGADDYIPKPFSLREQQLRLGDLRFDGQHLVAECRGRTVEITRREMDIVVYLHRHAGRIVGRRELLTEVWQYADAGIETRTVDIHVLKLRKKIAALAGDAPFITTVRGEGYRLDLAP